MWLSDDLEQSFLNSEPFSDLKLDENSQTYKNFRKCQKSRHIAAPGQNMALTKKNEEFKYLSWAILHNVSKFHVPRINNKEKVPRMEAST